MSITFEDIGKGRLCNQIIRNLSLSLLAEKYDLYAEYFNYDIINNKLGIELFVGKNKYKKTIKIFNNNYIDYLNNNKNIDANLDLMHDYFQTEEITTILQKKLIDEKEKIIEKNPYKDRYKNNNDLFIHIRLTDAKKWNVGLDYCVYCINLLKYDKIYIGTDDFDDEMIKKIKDLHPEIIFFENNPTETIQFASTCKNIVLSHGSFSAIIGYLGFFSNIYFPDIKPGWCPLDMFINKGFNKVDLNLTKNNEKKSESKSNFKKQIILVSTGVFQDYIKHNIEQLLKFNFDIHVITDLPFFENLEEYKSKIKLIDSDELKTNFDKLSKLDKNFRDGFWNNASKRLFLLYEYMKINEIKNVIHLENDVLLYNDMNYDFKEFIYLTMDSTNRCIPGIIYIPGYNLLKNLIENYNFKENDMYNLAKFYNNNKNIVKTFPIIDDSLNNCIYNENFYEFNSIFDGAAIGQYLGGVDPRNKSGDTRGFINETCEIKYNKYIFKWVKKEDNYFPHIEINNRLIPINNLHIHCKKLENFKMKNPEIKLEYSTKQLSIIDSYKLKDDNNSMQKKLDNLFNDFFDKKPNKTSHETLANYTDNKLIAGGEKGSFYTHICYHTIYKALSELIKQKQKEYIIVETGCSAHGTKSTLLWDKFVNSFGGKVLSVDLNKNSVNLTNKQTSIKTKVKHSDSLKYLPTITDKIDFLYLDSYDVDFLNPLPSAEHHLKEFNCIKHLLHENSIILIDDTPISPEWLDNGKCSPIYEEFKKKFDKNMTGKGSLVSKELKKMGAKKIMHQYQILWQIL